MGPVSRELVAVFPAFLCEVAGAEGRSWRQTSEPVQGTAGRKKTGERVTTPQLA